MNTQSNNIIGMGQDGRHLGQKITDMLAINITTYMPYIITLILTITTLFTLWKWFLGGRKSDILTDICKNVGITLVTGSLIITIAGGIIGTFLTPGGNFISGAASIFAGLLK